MPGFYVSGYLPEKVLSNEDLAERFEDWDPERVFLQTGVSSRRVAKEGEYASDLAVNACEKLFLKYNLDRSKIDFLIYVTQCQDYKLPATACLVHDRLGLSAAAGALDVNLGCSGFVYALSLAKGLIISQAAETVLIVTADALSRYVNKKDRGLAALIGDGAAAFLMTGEGAQKVGTFVFGTDGKGYKDIIIPAGGERIPLNPETRIEETTPEGHIRNPENISMNGVNVFTFAVTTVQNITEDVLKKNGLAYDDIDLFVFHQANKTILDYLRKRMAIPEKKFYINMKNKGNTSSSTIPLALEDALEEGRLKKEDRILVLGFGVGLSWCGGVLTW